MILVTQTIHSWIMVDSLVGLHLLNELGLYPCICPVEIPIHLLILVELEVKFPAGLLDDSIFGLACAQYQLLARLFLLGFFFVPFFILLNGLLLGLFCYAGFFVFDLL